MKHIKYPKIHNHTKESFIYDMLSEYPHAIQLSYIATEKLHGANFAVYLSCNGRDCYVDFATRNRMLNPTSEFYGWQRLLKKESFDNFLYAASKFIKQTGTSYVFYGELIGKKIQKGVDYGTDIDWRIFDIFSITNNTMLPPEQAIAFLEQINMKNMYVPIIAITYGLREALSINTEFPTKLNNIPGNICEGVVIKPYRTILYNSRGEIFYIKKKNKNFMEISRKPSTKTVQDPDLAKYLSYANLNRIESAESKIGRFQDHSQIPEFMKAIMSDIKEEIYEDMPEFRDLSKSEQKKILRAVSKEILKLLKSKLR